jgi:hypothetical protein
MVKLSRKYGLLGLAALTPILLSIPLGIFIITRLESSRSKILLYMFISVTCWSIIITSAFELTRHKNIPEIINKK